jgi:hypothetical protein
MPGAVELVESDRLKIGTKWVSVDFVYDSVRDQVLQDVHQYMAAAHAHNVAQQRNERIGEDPKRQGKVFFTASDDAKMLQFIVVRVSFCLRVKYVYIWRNNWCC